MRILSIDGGGYLGVAAATLLAELENHFKTTCYQRFDLFCGTSTGAIITLGLASGLTAREIVDLYKGLGSEVFGTGGRIAGSLRLARSFFISKYSNDALRRALVKVFGERTLGDLRQSGKRAVIPAFCVTNGRPRVFNTGQPPTETAHDGYRIADIAMASSAAPTYFPMVKLRRPSGEPIEEVFCDGGVVANHPAIIGFAEAVGRLRTRPEEIALLSISTPRIDLGEPRAARRSLSRGLLRWAPRLSSAFIDSGSTIMHEALRRIVDSFPQPGPLYVRLDIDNQNRLPMDVASENATDLLIRTGIGMAEKSTVRADLRPFFT